MDFFKKHFEKVILALALLTLIGVAIFLAIQVNSMTEQVKQGVTRRKLKTIDTIRTTIYTNAVTGLRSPSEWHTNVDLYRTFTVITDTSTVVIVDTRPKDIFELKEITRKSFRLVFKSYTGTGENFAINFITGRHTFFVRKVGDPIEDVVARPKIETGFTVTKFERKFKEIERSGIPIKVDVSELTITDQKGQNIILVLNIPTQQEPEAVVICLIENQSITIHKGQRITCGGKTYIVVDIGSTQVIIEDEATKERQTIILPGAKE